MILNYTVMTNQIRGPNTQLDTILHDFSLIRNHTQYLIRFTHYQLMHSMLPSLAYSLIRLMFCHMILGMAYIYLSFVYHSFTFLQSHFLIIRRKQYFN